MGRAGRHRDPQETRREVARDLDLGDLAVKPDRFMALPDRLWVLGAPLDPWSDGSSGLRARIDRHVFRNPGDWSAEDLFEELGAFEAGDARFGKFLEGLACADVIPDEPAQRRVAAAVNPHLRSAGAELGETGTDGGYPVFSVISTRPVWVCRRYQGRISHVLSSRLMWNHSHAVACALGMVYVRGGEE